MEKYQFKFKDNDIPKYIQITKNIKKLIENEEVLDGEKLPTIRELKGFYSVNSVTIVSAYKRLQSEGYAVMKRGSGTYAKRKEFSFKKRYSDIFKKINIDEMKNYVDFAGETTNSDILPIENFKKVLNEVLDRDGTDALSYQDVLGFNGLRKSINEYFWNGRLNDDDILIVSGAQQGIDIIAKAILNVNDNVLVEKPTYSGALSVFKWRRANILEANISKNGIDLDQVKDILKKNRIKCFYTMSCFQNPTGYTYSTEKKLAMLKLAKKYDFYIIEDDYLSELTYDKSKVTSFKSLDTENRVIYIKSFSKIFLPGIRIGYLLSPSKFLESIQNAKMNTDITTSSLMQRALDLYIREGFWKEHIKNLNRIYKERFEFMQRKVESSLKGAVQVVYPKGGLNLYCKLLNSKIDSIDLFYECQKNNVLLTPGVIFYRNESEGKKYFRLSFAHTDLEEIERGINKIAEILK